MQYFHFLLVSWNRNICIGEDTLLVTLFPVEKWFEVILLTVLVVYVSFLKISFYRKPRKIFWTVFTSHIHKCAKYCVRLYCLLTVGTANVILPGENFGIERTPLWTNEGHLTLPATLLMTSRESAGVTLPLEFLINFSSFFTSEYVT